MPQVIVEQPGVPPMSVPLVGSEVTFGRSEDNHVVLVAEEVSRHDVRLYFRDNMWVLRDMKSLNGTYVNRQRIVERALKHLDEIFLGGKCRLIFRDDTAMGTRSPAAK